MFAQAGPALVIGGDPTIEVGVVEAITRTTNRVGLLYVDTGPDLNTPRSVSTGFSTGWACRICSASPTRATSSRIMKRADVVLVHLDVDVMDFIDSPVADFPTINAGLTFEATMECIEVFVRGATFMGLTITVFDPDHVDEHEQPVTVFVERLTRVLAGPR